MREPRHRGGDIDRREFLKGMVGLGGAAIIAGCSRPESQAGIPAASTPAGAATSAASQFADRIGIQLYTVRDHVSADYRGALERLAAIGYREVEPTGYGDMTPQQFRQLLDDVGLTAPSTHANLIPGPNLEAQLEGYQIIGHKYARATPTLPGTGPGQPAPNTVETWQRRAAVYNEIGQVARRYGIRVIVHNHTEEFIPIEGTELRPYDILMAETDPEVFAWQLDIGWSTVAGLDAVELFRQHPGRFPSWHVKDVTGGANLAPGLSIPERQRAMRMARLGEGEVDWRAIFDAAELSGLEHIFVEIEGPPTANGQSMEASEAAYRYLSQLLRG